MASYDFRITSKTDCSDSVIKKIVFCPPLNHFIFVDERGNFFLADAACEFICGPVAVTRSLDSNIFIEYSSFHNCLLCWDKYKLNSRRDLSGTWHLKTILYEKPLSVNNENIEIELSLKEATKLLQYLMSPSFKLHRADEQQFGDVVDELRSEVAKALEFENTSRGHKWATVTLRGNYDFLSTVMTDLLTDLRLNNYRLPILPVVSAIIERLRLFLPQPYSISLNMEGGIDKTVMASEAARRRTFSRWPHMDYKWCLPDQMAEAGFYHQPNAAGDDRIYCFTCTMCLVCWEPADEPWSEHERHSPNCPFVRGEYTHNVPVSVVYASSFAQNTGCSEPISVVSQASYCDWVATSTRYGEVVLWNIAKDLQHCGSAVLDPSDPFIETKTGYRCRPRRRLKGGVAWTDVWTDDSTGETSGPSICPPSSSSSSHTTNSEVRKILESPANEIANEIVAVCAQKGDLIVTAACCHGRPPTKQNASQELNDLLPQCSVALIVGCGILESKLRGDRALEASSISSFVENLNTVNLATSIISTCILPPKPTDGASPLDEQHQRYRPFLLVYKIESCVNGDGNATATAPVDAHSGRYVEKTSLPSVKETVEEQQFYNDEPKSYDTCTALDVAKVLPIKTGGSNTNNQPSDSFPEYEPTSYELDEDDILQTLGDAVPTTSVDMAPVVGENLVIGEARQLHAGLSVLQCLHLPAPMDSSAYVVHSITPLMENGGVVVAVNKIDKDYDSAVCSALVSYRLSYSCHITSLVEQPQRQVLFDADVGIINSVVVMQSVSVGEMKPCANLVSVLTVAGEVHVVNLDTGQTVARQKPPTGKKYTAACAYYDDKLCASCDDGTVYMLELLRPDVLCEELLDENCSQPMLEDPDEWRDFELLVNKPLTTPVLKDLWSLTRCDSTTLGQFSMDAPSSWVEVQQHQRLRKNPQHYLREEKVAKSWHLVPDADTYKSHVFEITLPTNFVAGHIDFRFNLHQAPVATLPYIQVSLLRQAPSSGRERYTETLDMDNSMDNEQKSSRSRGVGAIGCESTSDVIAGPFDLHSSFDLSNTSGLIQFALPVFTRSKLRTFYIHIQALTKDIEIANRAEDLSGASSTSVVEPTDGRYAAGLYQQKYGFGKYAAPTSAKAQAGSRLITSKNAIESKKSEDRKGCDWLQEVSITVWRAKKTELKRERKQKAAMLRNVEFFGELVRCLDRESFDVKTVGDTDVFRCRQYLALELLVWMLEQGCEENRRAIECTVSMLLNRMNGLLRSCYVNSNRTISRKFTSFVAQLISKMQSINSESAISLTSQLKSSVRELVLDIGSYTNSGSSLWLIALTEELYKMSPIGCSAFITELQTFLCSVGDIVKKQASIYSLPLCTKYGLSSFALDLEMFELPPPFLTLMQRTEQVSTYATVVTGVSSTAVLCGDSGQEEFEWLSMVGSDFVPSNTPGSRCQSRGRLIRLEREHLYGLIEVEPLQFSCLSASDGIRVENLDTGLSISVAELSNAMPTSTGAGPIPLPDITQYEQSANPALTTAVNSMKQHVQNILNKHMQLLAIHQQRQKIQGKLADHVAKLATSTSSEIPATQTSSASTFGVPTTPKTTPFMTPTPLSPSHLSPINSESDLQLDNAFAEAEEGPSYSVTSKNDRRPKLLPLEFLKPPPVQVLVVDRMISGARKFVTFSFERPVLLTDMILPQCGEIGSLSVDVWLKSESEDGQRLVVCNDISQKTLVLCDLQPPCFCQCVKITYVGRHGLGSCTSRIPVGCFYGYTHVTLPQLFAVDGGSTLVNEDMKLLRRPPLSIDQLQQLQEDLRCRYNLARELMRKVTELPDCFFEATQGLEKEFEAAKGEVFRDIFREMASVRVQWNLVRRTAERMDWNKRVTFTADAASTCSYDKACVISEILFAALIRISLLIKQELSLERTILSYEPTPILNFDEAVQMFGQFCIYGLSSLTALCSTWILYHGAHTNWWGAFFCSVIGSFFDESTNPDQLEKIFLILIYLIDRGIAAGNHAIFLELLHRINTQLADGIERVPKLFEWTLLLLALSFDSFPHGRLVSSRWDFLLGEYSKKRSSSVSSSSAKTSSGSSSGNRVKVVNSYGSLKDALNQDKDYLKKPLKPQAPSKLKPSMSASAISDTIMSPSVSKTESTTKKPRLKLPFSLCRSVARKLATLALRSELSFSTEVYVLLCKVLSILTRYSRPLLHLADVFAEPGQIDKLVEQIVVSRNPYVHRALLCLAQDLQDSESKCETVQNAAAHLRAFAASGSSYYSATTSGGDQSATTCLSAFSSIPSTAGQPTKDDDQPSTSAKSAGDIFQANVNVLTTPADAKAYIESLIASVEPAAVIDCKISKDKRRQRLRALCKEVLYARISSLNSPSDAKDCLTAAINSERTLAECSVSEASYEFSMQKRMVSHSQGKSYLMDLMESAVYQETLSSSGAGAAASSVVPTYIPTPCYYPTSTMSSFAGIGSAQIRPFAPPFIHNPPANQNLSEAKDALSKLCEHLQSSAAKVMLLPSSSNVSAPPPSSDAIVFDLGPLESMSGMGSIEDGIEPANQTLWDDDSDSTGTPVESDPQTPVIYNVANNAIPTPSMTTQHLWKPPRFKLESHLAPLSIADPLQPISFSLDERIESQLGWHGEVMIRRWLLSNSLSLRTMLKSATTFQKPSNAALYALTSRDSGTHVHLASKFVVAEAFTRLFESLSDSSSSFYVDSLLRSFWQLSIGSKVPKSQDVSVACLVPTVQLGESAVKQLLHWLLKSFGLTEKLWTFAFRVLAISVRLKQPLRNGKPGGPALTLIDNLTLVIRRFISDVCAFGTAQMAGPAVVQAFSDMLTGISMHFSAVSSEMIDRFREALLRVLFDLLRQRGLVSLKTYPIDVVNKLVEFLLNQVAPWCLDADLSCGFAYALASGLPQYMASCNAYSEPFSCDDQVNPLYCFRIASKTGAFCNTQFSNEICCCKDGLDAVLANLLKLCDKIFNGTARAPENCNAGNGPTSVSGGERIASVALSLRPMLLHRLLEALSFCYCPDWTISNGLAESTADNGSAGCWTTTTPADAVFQLLTTLMIRTDSLSQFLNYSMEFLRETHADKNRICISNVSVHFFAKMFRNCQREALINAGVVEILAQQLAECAENINPSPANSNLLKMAAAVCGRGFKVSDSNSSSKKLTDMKIDGMTNFAPLCCITSSSPMAHHLTALLNTTPPNRRVRSATWFYHFYPAETWLDMTLTLPYPVVLREIQVRPQVGSLQYSPSVVQVELCSDTNLNSLTPLGPPIVTAGSIRMRISTESFQAPVRVVRLHFKRPADSGNLGISQIMLLGYPPLSIKEPTDDSRLRWLELIHCTLHLTSQSYQSVIKPEVSSLLFRHLIHTFLKSSLSPQAYSQIIDVLVSLPDCFAWLLERLNDQNCTYQNSVLPWLAELTRRLCSESAEKSNVRLSMLLDWVLQAITSFNTGQQCLSVSVLRCIVWTCACVLWNSSGLRETSSALFELLRVLCQCAKENRAPKLSTACGYLLCSLVHVAPEHLSNCLNLLGFNNFVQASTNTGEQQQIKSTSEKIQFDANVAGLRVLAFIIQSSRTVGTMEARVLLSNLVENLAKRCTEGDGDIVGITAIVELLASAATEPFIKLMLASSSGSIFWWPLLSYLCSSDLQKTARTEHWRNLETSTIRLLRQCLVCNFEMQQLASTFLSQLLSETADGLNSAIQQLILRVLLEDEALTVVIKDLKLMQKGLPLHHPKFGCGIHLWVHEVSIYSPCNDLLPELKLRKVTKSATKGTAVNVVGDGQQTESVFLGDVLNDGPPHLGMEKPKPKMIMCKASYGADKSISAKQCLNNNESNNKINSGNSPAYVVHELIGNGAPLPAKLTVGQLYMEFLRRGEEQDALYLTAKYESVSDSTLTANDALLRLPTPPSTLQVFASRGGLILLAEHLQLYQPTISVQQSGVRSSLSYFTDNELKFLEHMESSANKTFAAENDIADFDPSYEWVNLASNGTESYIVETKPSQSGRIRNLVSVGLSPHVVVCFGVFLRVAGYAELLVSRDRRKAQLLLRLAMGVVSSFGGFNSISSAEASSMGVLPFEILASLYCANPWKTEEGRLVRLTSMELSIPQLLLRCLSAFSHQAERRIVSADERPEIVRVVHQLLSGFAYAEPSGLSQQAEEKSNLYWAKGTGFGTGSTQQQWNVDLHIVKQKQDELNVTCLLKVLAQFIYPGDIQESMPTSNDFQPLDMSHVGNLPGQLFRLLYESCLLPTIEAYLRNDSVLDISRHVNVYDAIMRLLSAIAQCPALRSLLTDVSEQQQSLKTLLSKLKDCVDIYISKIEPLKKTGGPAVASEEAAAEEGLMKLVPLIEQTVNLVQTQTDDEKELKLKAGNTQHSSPASKLLSQEELYMMVMKPMQFDSYKFLDENNSELKFSVPYHYESSVKGAGKDLGTLAPRVRRLAQETVTLSTSLPLSYSSSVFVRTAEERLDVMKVFMIGPSDTPYANGCFEFDVWFPGDYPTSPMHINLQTTGGSTIRFNPNLYNDGKVCLSILNTWHGRPEERWNAQTSSFLQVLVSIQSLILVSEPYFNEPGYERSRGTPAGQQASMEYDANIRQATVRWGMLEMMRNPPACFKEVVQMHFWIKREEISKQIEGWIFETENNVGGVEKRIQRNLLTHLNSLKRHYNSLKEEFSKMTCPAILQVD